MSNYSGPEVPGLPASTLQNIANALQLLADLGGGLGVPAPPAPPEGGGPDDVPPQIPTGKLPGNVISQDDIQKIIDLLTGGIRYRIPSAIEIIDAELTQSTQFFNIDGLSSGAGGDNTVPLIANKVLVLRVFYCQRAGITGYVPDQITGEVRIAGQVIKPLNGPFALRAKKLVRRSNLDHSLNFLIPASLCKAGLRTFEVTLHDVYFPIINRIFPQRSPGRSTVSDSFTGLFRTQPPMKISGVMFSYAGPNTPGTNFNVPAPAGTALISTVARFLPMFPIHGYDFGPCTTQTITDDMRILPGVKGSGWDTTLNTLSNLRSASTIKTYYVGLLPKGLSTTIGTSNLGIGRVGSAIAAQDNTRALSHELGHANGLDHLNDGVAPPAWDLNYPNYGTFPYTSIGEYGLNTERMTLFDPNTDWDFMGYNDPPDVLYPVSTWISPYNYQKVLTYINATDGTGEIQVSLVVTLEAFMILNFRLHRNGRVELRPSYRVTGITPESGPRAPIPTTLDLLGRDGEIIGSHRCHLHSYYQEPDGPFLDFHEVVPWSDAIEGFAVVREGRSLEPVRVEGHAPKLELGELRRVQKEGDLAHLSWRTGEGDAALSTLIRYSPDEGRTWYAVAADLTGTSHLVNLDLLPGGEKCVLEVIASSGLQSASVRTEPFEVARKPRRAYLVSPAEGETFTAGCPISFLGGGHTPDGGTCDTDEVVWHSSLQGLLGTGYHVIRHDLQPGRHRITLSMHDGAQGEASASVWILVKERGEASCGG